MSASSLISLLFFWGGYFYFYLEPSQNQVYLTQSGQTELCWCSQLQPVLVAGVPEQCSHSLPALAKGQCQSIQRWHSTAAAPLWGGQNGAVVSENAWKEHLPQVDSPFLNYHRPAVVLGCSTEDSSFFPLWSFHSLMFEHYPTLRVVFWFYVTS